MTTTPSPPSPSNLRPRRRTPPATVLQSGTRPPKPMPGSLQLPTVSPANPVNQLLAVPQQTQPTRPTRPTTTSCQVRNTRPTRPTRSPSHRSGLSQSSAPSPPAPQPSPTRSPSSQAYPPARLTLHPHACSQILTFRPLPIKPHVIFIGKGRFCLYLCHACIYGTACICTTCRYKYPRHPLGAPGISVKDQSVHLMILVTRPEPTVRPPSRIAKPRPSSMAMGWIS